MPVHFDDRKRRWRFQFRRTVAGRPVRTSRLLPAGWSRAQAEAFDRAESSRLWALASGLLRESPGIELAVRLYLEDRAGRPSTLHTTQELAACYGYYAGKTFDDLPAIAQEYARDMRGTLAPATIRNRLAYLRAACNWAWKHAGMGDGQAPPGARMAMPSVRNARQVYLLPEEVERAAALCPPDTAALVRLAFYCGLRWRSELLPRQPADVVDADGERWLLVGQTKNGTPRMVPVHPAARASLEALPFARNGRRMYDEWMAAVAAIGRPGVRMHDLRHSLASAIISGGGTLSDVQGALHHVSIQSSARYAHLYPARLKAVLFKVGVPAKAPTKRRKSAHRDDDEKPKQAA